MPTSSLHAPALATVYLRFGIYLILEDNLLTFNFQSWVCDGDNDCFDNTDEGGSKNLAEVDDGSKKADDDDDDDDADEGGGKDEKAQWKHGNAEDD